MPTRIGCMDLNEEELSILKYLDHKPTEEECERYTKSHTQRYADLHFYLFKFNRRSFGLTTHTLSSDNIHSSNIL